MNFKMGISSTRRSGELLVAVRLATTLFLLAPSLSAGLLAPVTYKIKKQTYYTVKIVECILVYERVFLVFYMVTKIRDIFIICFLYVPVSGARVEFQGVTPGAISPIFRGTPSSLDRKIYNKHRQTSKPKAGF